MAEQKIEYTVKGRGQKYPEDAQELRVDPTPPFEQENEDDCICLAEDAAGQVQRADPCGDWPLDIEIFVDGKSWGVFEVEREAFPVFSARAK